MAGVLLHSVQHDIIKGKGKVRILLRVSMPEKIKPGIIKIQDGVQHIDIPLHYALSL